MISPRQGKSMRELKDILGKLTDLLVKVPRLGDRKGRDAWLSKNLERNMYDQIHRDDNCRNDLSFIISDTQNLYLQDGRWAVDILLDDLVNELRGIKLADDIKEVREEIARILERAPVGPKPLPKPKTPGPKSEPILPGDPKRQEWLKRLGFRRDPFFYTDGGSDPYLQEYFYFDMRHFADIRADISKPGTVFVFGPSGSGKSSLRNVISQLCPQDGILLLVYQDLAPLVRDKEGDGVQEGHVTQILKTALRTLANLAKQLSEKIESLPETEENNTIRNQLWLYVSRYEDDPLRIQTLKKLLKPGRRTKGKLPTDTRELLGRFYRYVTQLFKYQFAYILVDPDDDIAPDEGIAWQVLEPLLAPHRLLELAEYRASFKFFLGKRFRERALQIPWIKQEQSRRVRDLEWPDNELRALLEVRLSQCSEGRRKRLEDLSEGVESLDDSVIQLSMGNPRELIGICDQLFSEHCRRWSPDDGEPLLITAQEVSEVLKPFEKRHRESALERLIAQGENERVEFKSTMRYNRKAGQTDKEMEREVARTLCAFLNAEGGTLIIGVDDDGIVLGLEDDLSTLGRRRNKDGFERAFVNITKDMFDPSLSPNDYKAYFEECRDELVYIVEVRKSEKPIYCHFDNVREFYIRQQTTTRKLDPKDTVDYALKHFQSGPT
ncbi:MAG: putative DNA binding domain-containing protein [Thermoflexales bacterium]|nr:putative DNA binding domain-containing protein [Thermoflexales bacterium]